MARHGENIRKRKDGRWEGRYKTYSERKKRHIYRSVYASTYEQVKEKLAAAKLTLQKNPGSGGSFKGSAAQQSARRAAAGLLLSDAAMAWLREKEKQCKYSTYIKYEAVYRVHLSAFFSCHSLADAESGAFFTEISDHISLNLLSESLQKSICCVANQIFQYISDIYGFRVPLLKPHSLKSGKKTGYSGSMDTFTEMERQRLFASIYKAPDKYGAAVILCLHTGLRIGELCALRWEDVNLKDMTLNVERTVQRIAVRENAVGEQDARSQGTRTAVRTALMETEPKSKSSRRTIPLTAEAVRLLAGLHGQQSDVQPYVFGGERPLEPRTLQYRFKKALAMAGVEDRNFHMLRHTFATSCIESGMDVKSLSEILGHSDVKFTMNRYVHPTMDSKRKQLGVLSAFYGRICGQEDAKSA